MLSLAVALWLTGSAPAPPIVDLRWEAPAGCPDQAALERRLAAMRAGGPAPANPPRVGFRVERRGEGWHLDGEISGPGGSGRRELDAATCAELADAAVLITAIALDPEMSAEGPTIPPPPVIPPAPGAAADRDAGPGAAGGGAVGPGGAGRGGVGPGGAGGGAVGPGGAVAGGDAGEQRRDGAAGAGGPQAGAAPRTPGGPAGASPGGEGTATARRARARARLSGLLGLSGGLGLGVLPAPAGLLRLAAGVRGARWSVALVQDLWLPREVAAAEDPAFGGRFWLWAAGARGCGVIPAGRVEVPLCATVWAGVMTGRGVGALSPAQTRRTPWVAASLGPGLRVPIGRRLGLILGAELLAVLARPRFEISGQGTLCCTAPVGGQFTGGVELRLP